MPDLTCRELAVGTLKLGENDGRGRAAANKWLIAAAALIAAFVCIGFGQNAYAAVCTSLSDDFNGSTLDEGKWDTVLREFPGSQRMQDGQLQIRISNTGDVNPATDIGAANQFLQSMPATGAWTATAKINRSASLTADQIGIIFWRGETPNHTWGKAVFNQNTATNFSVERNATINGTTVAGGVVLTSQAALTTLTNNEIWVRISSTGGASPTITTTYSTNGTTFTNVGSGGAFTFGGTGPIKAGVYARSTSASTERWPGFDSFVVETPANCPAELALEADTATVGTAPLSVDFDATVTDDNDAIGALNLAWDYGDGGTDTGQVSRSHTFTNPGTYRTKLTVTDSAGLTTERSVWVTVLAAAQDTCVDNFNGNALNTTNNGAMKWYPHSRLNGGPVASGGNLQVPMMRNGEVLAANFRTTQMPLVDAPTDQGWTATAKFNSTGIDVNGEQAGLAFIQSAGPLPSGSNNNNVFSKAVYIRPGTGTEPRRFEHIVTHNANSGDYTLGDNTQSNTAAPAPLNAAGSHDILMRGHSDGVSIWAEFSPDNGATWTQIGQRIKMTGPVKIGLIAIGNNTASNTNDSGGSAGPTNGVISFDRFEMDCGPQVEIDASVVSGTTPLEVDFDATVTDNEDNLGDIDLEWDFTDGSTVSGGTDQSHTFLSPGIHRVTLTATDSDGNISVGFVNVNVELNRSGNCTLPATDEFNGGNLDPKWTVLRPNPSGIVVEDGTLTRKAYAGDMHNTDTAARNVMLMDAPSGAWVAETKMDVSGLTAGPSGDQAGMIAWRQEGASLNNFSKFVFNRRTAGATGDYWLETSRTANSAQAAGAGNSGLINTGDQTIWMRYTSNGATPTPSITAEYSLNGTTWNPVEVSAAGGPTPFTVGGTGPLRIGLVYFGGNNLRYAKFDYFRVTEVGCDDVLPEVEHEMTPAAPDGPDGAWLPGADLALDATDDASDPEDIDIEYRVNGGAWTSYTAPVDFPAVGEYEVDYRAEDESFNVGIGSFEFEVAEAPAASNCDIPAKTDEFTGSSLDAKWTVTNPDVAGNLRVENGSLRHNLLAGDIGGNFGGASGGKNTVLQPAPAGAWVATTKMDISNLNANSNQVGFVLWSAGNVSGDGAARQWAKLPLAHRGGDLFWFEWNYQNGATGTSQNIGNQSDRPGVIWERVSSNGANPPVIRADYSLDGQSWRQIGSTFTLNAAAVANLHIGLAGFNGAALNSSIAFDYLRLCDPTLDTQAPSLDLVTTPASPDGSGGTFASAVTVDLPANDGDGSGVALREYRINGGAWTTFVKPFVLLENGSHQVEYRATDLAGNASGIESETIVIDRAAETCTSTDPFNGSTLDPSWTTQLRTTGLTVSGGNLNFPFATGDLYGGTATGRALLKDVPINQSWAATTFVDVTALGGVAGAQVGLVAWKGEGASANNFTKMILNRRSTNMFWIEWGRTINSAGTNANGGEFSTASTPRVGVRAVYDHAGRALNLFFSMNDGVTWLPVNAPTVDGVNYGDAYKVGLVAMGASSTAIFTEFRLDTGDCALPDDVTDPVTTHSINPGTADGPGGAWLPGVQVSLSATDDRSIPVNITSEYSLNGGTTWNPYTGPVQLNTVGSHTVSYRSTDMGGNVEATKSVTVEVAIDNPGTCTDSTDAFDGSSLDPKWEIISPNATHPSSVADGHLVLPLVNGGDIYQASVPPSNTLLQPVPAGNWVATAKVEHAGINGTASGKGAGLALVNAFTPNYLAKSALQYKDDADPVTPGNQPGVWAERVMTVNNVAQILPGDGGVAWPNSGPINPPGQYVWVRMVHNAAANVFSTWTSIDGIEFKRYGQNMPAGLFNQNGGALRLGLFGKHDTGPAGTRNGEVKIDFFNVVGGTANPQLGANDCPVLDTEAPESTHAFDPATPDHSDGDSWLPGVELSLSATDNVSAPGDIDIEYSDDGGTTWEDYTSPLEFDDVGEYEISYRATDEADNTETPANTVEFVVAEEPPVVCTPRTDEFNGDSLNTGRWAFRWDSTDPVVSAQRPPAPTVSGGNMNMIAGPGESHPNGNGAIGYVGQEIPTGDWTIDMKFSAPNLVTAEVPTPIQYTQAGVMLYQTDGDFIKVVKIQRENLANSYWESTSRNNMGALTTVGNWGNASAAITAIDPFWFRMVKTGNTVQVYRAIADPVGNPSNWIQTDISTAGYNLATIFAEADGPVYFGPTGMLGNTAFQVDYVRVSPDIDCEAPVSTHTLNPAAPDGPDGKYLPGVQLSLAATDNVSSPANIDIEYSTNGGTTWLPYSAALTFNTVGDYTIQYRATDEADNVESPAKTVSFGVVAAPADPCAPRSDEFAGSSLDAKWQILRSNPARLTVTGGQVNLGFGGQNTDMNGATANAVNVLLQPAPTTGAYRITSRVDISQAKQQSNQAGIVLWQNEGTGANRFYKITFNARPTDTPAGWRVERANTVNSSTTGQGNGPTTVTEPGAIPDEVWLRADVVPVGADRQVTAYYSKNGTDWIQILTPHLLTNVGAMPIRAGVVVVRGENNATGHAGFDYFRLCEFTPDTEAPVSTAALNPAAPNGPGGAWLPGTTLALSATDNESASGDIDTEYSLDNGTTWLPYTTPVAFNTVGSYSVQYRSTDEAGNVETAKTVTFAIAEAPSGGDCTTAATDEFTGSTLDPKWIVNNPDAGGNLTVAGGKLTSTLLAGDIGGNFGGASGGKNTLLQPAPAAGKPWVATTQMDVSNLTVGNNQAGFVLWSAGNVSGDGAARQWAKIPFAKRGAGTGYWFEWNYQNGATGTNQNTGDRIEKPNTIWQRISSNGANPAFIKAEFSIDGTNWVPIGAASGFQLSAAAMANLHIGLAAFNGNGTTSVGFEYFRLCDASLDTVAPTTSLSLNPATGTGAGGSYTIPVTVTLTGNDGANGSGAVLTEYRFNGGPWKTYTLPVKVTNNGTYNIDYRSTDGGGNVEVFKSSSFTINRVAQNCTVTNDPFDGTTLGAGWDTLRTPAPVVGGGNLTFQVGATDMHNATATAPVVLRDAPNGSWSASTLVDVSAIAANSGQAGIIVWKSEGDGNNNFIKLVANRRSGTPLSFWIERVQNINSVNTGTPNAGTFPLDANPVIGLMVEYNASTGLLNQYVSRDNGVTWQTVSPPIAGADYGTGTRVGLSAFGAASGGTAAFSEFSLASATCVFPVPQTAPTGSIVITPTAAGQNGWHITKPVTATVNITDPDDTVETVGYRIGTSGAFTPYTAPVALTAEGAAQFQVQVTHTAPGSPLALSAEVKIDTIAGTTTRAVVPAAPNGQAGWYTSPVTVNLTATDASSGVNRVEHRLSSDGAFTPTAGATASAQFTTNGQHLIEYRSVDNAGNTESTSSFAEIKIDATAPTTLASLSPNVSSTTDPVTVTLTGTDNVNGSGVATTQYSLDGGTTWLPYVNPFVVASIGEHTVHFRSTDVAGNVATAQTVSFEIEEIDDDPPVVIDLGDQQSPFVIALPLDDPSVARAEFRIIQLPADNGPYGWEEYDPTKPITILALGEYRVDYRWYDEDDNVSVTKAIKIKVVPPPLGPAKLNVSVDKSKLKVSAKKKTTTLKATVSNTGESASETIRMCITAPKKKVGVDGPKCRNIVGIGVGIEATQSFKLKLKKKLKGKLAVIRVTVTSEGAAPVTKTFKLRQAKK